MKNILLTGGRGFIGFNALKLWSTDYSQYNYCELDADTYADKIYEKDKNMWLESVGIPHYTCDLSLVESEKILSDIIEKHDIDTIIHMGCESHVDNSINNPTKFFMSNVIGTVNILNIVKKYNLRLHIVSTDEVYGETTPSDWFNNGERKIEAENKILIPSSPYSSSKASADMIALSYNRTFGTRVSISRCTNNFGPYQHYEKLIGTVISKALRNEEIPVYGAGTQKRHWIHVSEHNKAVMDILENGCCGKIYNIAPPEENWITNIELIKYILEILDKPYSLISHVTDRLGHDTSYFLYGTEFCARTRNWKTDMPETINWYRNILKDI